MKLTTEALRAALKTVAPAVQVNAQIPALAGVKITATDDALIFASSDYQTWIETRAVCEPELGGGWVGIVSHRLLNQIAGTVRAKEVNISPDGNVLRIAAGKSFWLAPLIGGDAPAVPATPKKLASLDASAFAAMVSKVAMAATPAPTLSPALHVVQLSAEKSGLRLAATDRYRIHQDGTDAKAAGTVTIYPEAAGLAKIAGALSGTVTVYAEKDSDVMGLADEATTVLTRTVSVEKWVKVEELIASSIGNVKARTTVPAAELLGAVKAASAALPDDSIGVRLVISRDEFTVAAADTDSGAQASADVEEFNHDGPALTACVRAALLGPTLALSGDEVVELAWVKPGGGPILITQPGKTGVCVVMSLSVPGAGWAEQ